MDHEESAIGELVTAAADGDAAAWGDLVRRYTPLLVVVLRRYRLSHAEVEDVAQTVWLRMVEHLGDLRDPRALPMWISTTAKRECLRHLSRERRAVPFDPLERSWPPHPQESIDLDQELLRAERHQALMAGLAELSPRQRELLVLLSVDPPLSYQEIRQRTGIPTGSIGPTRSRALERLRSSHAVRAYLTESHPESVHPRPGGERHDPATMG